MTRTIGMPKKEIASNSGTLITSGSPPIYIIEERLKANASSYLCSVWSCEATAQRVCHELQWTNYGHVEEAGDRSFFQIRCFLLQQGDE